MEVFEILQYSREPSAGGLIPNPLISFFSLGSSQAVRAVLRLVAFSVVTKHLSVSEMGTFLSAVAICELFQFLTLPGVNKVVLREAVRDLGRTPEIMTRAAPLRNMAVIFCIGLAILFAQILVSDIRVRYLIFLYSSLFFFDAIREYARVAFQAHEKFHILSASEVAYSGSYCVSLTIAAIFWGTAESVVCAAAAAAAIGMVLDVKWSAKYGFKFSISVSPMPLDIVKASVVFTLTNTAFLIMSKIDMFMLSFMAPAEAVAQYGVAQRLIFVGLMGLSVASTIAYPFFIKNTQRVIYRVKNKFGLIILGLIAIYLVVFFTGTLFGEDLIRIIADERYLSAAPIFNILLIFLFIQVVITPLKLFMYVENKERSVLFALVPCTVLKGPLNYVLYHHFGTSGIAMSTCIVFGMFASALAFTSVQASKAYA